MPVPVRFYSMTAEQYEKIRKEMEQGEDGSEEAQQRRRDLEGGIFFISGNEDEVKSNGSSE